MEQSIATPVVLASFSNEDSGLTSFVTRTDNGFSVSLRDDDSGEFLPTVKFFDQMSAAKFYAKWIVEQV